MTEGTTNPEFKELNGIVVNILCVIQGGRTMSSVHGNWLLFELHSPEAPILLCGWERMFLSCSHQQALRNLDSEASLGHRRQDSTGCLSSITFLT